jgi:hypothetical protein
MFTPVNFRSINKFVHSLNEHGKSDNVVSEKALERTDHVNVLEHKNFLAKAKETIAAPGTKRFRK